jgi:hypothetical protein
MQDYCGRMKRNGKNHRRNPNWESTSLIISIEKKKTSPRLVKQALQRPQERNKGHLKLRGRRRGKGRGSPSQKINQELYRSL